MSTAYDNMLDIHNYVHTLPYCTSSGSYSGGTDGSIIGSNAHNGHPFPNVFVFGLIRGNHVTNDGQGCILVDTHVGFQGFLITNVDYSLCSDGFHFSFVATQSALDYTPKPQPVPNLSYDIEDDPVNDKLASIPEQVDVITGYTGENILTPGGNKPNHEHLGLRNDDIRTLTNLPAVFGNFDNTYFSCINYDPLYAAAFLTWK